MSEEHDQKKWDAILQGKRLPKRNDRLELKAYKARQAVLWNMAVKYTHERVSREYAEYAYTRAYRRIKRQRYLRVVLFSFLVVIFLFALYFINTFFMNWAAGNAKQSSNGLVSSSISEVLLADIPSMIVVPSGDFDQGCSAGWDDKFAGCSESETPVQSMKVKSFALSRFEVTVGQFKRFVNETSYVTTAEKDANGCTIQTKDNKWILSREHSWKKPGFEQTDQHPVVCMSWIDAQSYIAWLSKSTGKSYRLPSESEWEYAARGGKANPFYWGDQPDRRYANYLGVEGDDRWAFTAPVGSTTGNDFGLHDMLGNAWEWVGDCWRKDYNSECENEDVRVRRGGGWDNLPKSIRSAYRSKGYKAARSYLYGFRVAHDVE